jgi:hypothetical protein
LFLQPYLALKTGRKKEHEERTEFPKTGFLEVDKEDYHSGVLVVTNGFGSE